MTEDQKKRMIALEEENIKHKQTIKEIARNMYRVIRALGLSTEDLKQQQVAKKKVLKAIPMIAMDATMNPKAIEEKFSFLGKFGQIFEDNKELVGDRARKRISRCLN